jgi:hypothetical protein
MANFHENLSYREIIPPSERSTGFVFAGMAAIVSGLWYRHPSICIPAGVISLGFLFVSLLAPSVLRPLNLLWFRLSMLLYKIVNPVVMLLMYVLAIVPTGLIMQRLRDPLRTKRQSGQATYWVENLPGPSGGGSMKNQF